MEQVTQVNEQISLQEATKLFNNVDQINVVKKLREEMNKQRTGVLGEDTVKKLSERISNLTPEDLKKMDEEEINNLYKFEDGEIEVALEFKDKNKEIEFKRDYLVYLRETDIALKQIDGELDKLEAEIKEEEDKIKSLLSEFGDLSTFMRSKLQEEYDSSDGERKEKIGKVIEAFDDSYTLNRVYEYYTKYSTSNTIDDYYRRAEQVFNKFMKAIKKVGLKTDLTSFNNLELKFLDEKYHKYPNLFLFSVIKMFSYKRDTITREDGVFLSQLAVNLKSLYADSFKDPEKKQLFINSISKVLDLFYK